MYRREALPLASAPYGQSGEPLPISGEGVRVMDPDLLGVDGMITCYVRQGANQRSLIDRTLCPGFDSDALVEVHVAPNRRIRCDLTDGVETYHLYYDLGEGMTYACVTRDWIIDQMNRVDSLVVKDYNIDIDRLRSRTSVVPGLSFANQRIMAMTPNVTEVAIVPKSRIVKKDQVNEFVTQDSESEGGDLGEANTVEKTDLIRHNNIIY